ESNFGFELAMEWIDDKNQIIAAAGWSTLCSLVAIKQDNEMDIQVLKTLLKRVEDNIHQSDNRVKLKMNTFVISAGSYVIALTDYAIAVAKKIGEVKVNMGGTACKVPDAVSYILKIKDRGTLGKKKKMARC
ncbi:MAG TPA: hypothetical protein PLA68_14200, partial [Panacibacter sp.]|nr:hypothetical protein [Panacibacter sp.]